MSDCKPCVLVRGGGDLASGVALVLRRAEIPVVIAERNNPQAVRRAVSFCEAVHEGSFVVEGVEARLCESGDEALALARKTDVISLVVDARLEAFSRNSFVCAVDARMMKRPMESRPECSPLWIGLGPGFVAGQDVDVVVETHREAQLGKIIRQGSAMANTGTPGIVGGEGIRRVVRSSRAGEFQSDRHIGELIDEGDLFGHVIDEAGIRHDVLAPLTGKIRGLIRPGSRVSKGHKIGDVDPRGTQVDHRLVSDKARLIGSSVLEIVQDYL